MLILPAQLRHQIEDAFQGVTLGDGVGLRQGRAMDDYEDEKGQREARVRDEKDDWKAIPDKDLKYYYSSPNFLDADGMRFHLPAYMLSDEYRDNNDTLTFHLTHLNDYGKSQFTSLTALQRAAVRDYLIWCDQQENYIDESQEIRNAVSEYWNEN
jgi:hypothetical protein